MGGSRPKFGCTKLGLLIKGKMGVVGNDLKT